MKEPLPGKPVPSLDELAQKQRSRGALAELCQLFAENKAYWLVPVVVILLGLGVLLLVGGSAAAPFIYSLF